MRVRVHARRMEKQRGQSRTIGDYVTVQEVGAGSFAVVWKARHKLTGDEVAIKEIALEKLNKKLQESLLSEITILRKTNHPNIIRLHDIVEGPGRIFLVLEYCAGGDLAAYIHRHGKVPEATARKFMQQLGLGLQVLRKNNLIHRDLKPQNLLLSADNDNAVLKIADFGFARSLQPQGMAETLCGSPLYMAPEILHMQKYDAKADLWSVGAILFQLVTGKPPFLGDSHAQLLLSIRKNEVQFPDAAKLHPECIDMCRKLLRRNPVERLSFEEFFAHPFMRESSSTLPTRTMSTDIDVGEPHSDDCLPFLLDDVPKQSPRFGPGHRITSGLSHGSILRDPKPPAFDEASRDPFFQRPLDGDGDAEVPFHANSPKTVALLDSMEYIEREYVVVKPGDMSLSASTIDQHAASRNDKNFLKPPSPVTHLVPTTSRVSPPVETSPVDSGEVPSARLASLQRHARLLSELATDNFDGGRPLEALSVQLVCLAILKEALHQASRLPSSNSADKDEDPAVTYSQVEQEFCAAVDRGEAFASQLGHMDVSAEMPDAIEIIFQAALFSGRNGGVDELMGNVSKASVAYAKAVTFLYFLIFEACPLQLASLTPSDRQRLSKYADMLNARLNACSRPSSS